MPPSNGTDPVKTLALTAQTVSEGEKHLSKVDPVMAHLVSSHGPCPLARREFRPFHTIVRSIISQQLSSKAAATIERRLSDIVSTPFRADSFLGVSSDALRLAGLSAAKGRYIQEIAARVADRRLNLGALRRKPDQDVITILTDLPGIGRWTAEMFLIFSLKRPDVLALGDAGLQRSAKMLYGRSTESVPLETLAHPWRPFRSVASWYLWEHLDATAP